MKKKGKQMSSPLFYPNNPTIISQTFLMDIFSIHYHSGLISLLIYRLNQIL
jgi:hypothetical protein